MHELVKVIGPKNDPPQVVQEKVLSLIQVSAACRITLFGQSEYELACLHWLLALLQTWADAFQGSPELKEVGKTYMELKSKGIEFPMTDLDGMAPIHTPARVCHCCIFFKYCSTVSKKLYVFGNMLSDTALS